MKKITGSQYINIHVWLKNNYGKASFCESPDCSRLSSRFQWALKRNFRYAKRRTNFIQLCVKCHAIYDGPRRGNGALVNYGWRNVPVEVSDHAFLKEEAKRQGITMAALLTNFVRQLL